MWILVRRFYILQHSDVCFGRITYLKKILQNCFLSRYFKWVDLFLRIHLNGYAYWNFQQRHTSIE